MQITPPADALPGSGGKPRLTVQLAFIYFSGKRNAEKGVYEAVSCHKPKKTIPNTVMYKISNFS